MTPEGRLLKSPPATAMSSRAVLINFTRGPGFQASPRKQGSQQQPQTVEADNNGAAFVADDSDGEW